MPLDPGFLQQLAAAAFSSVWALAFTYAMLWLIDCVTAVRVTSGHRGDGLDSAIHGEQAYLGDAI